MSSLSDKAGVLIAANLVKYAVGFTVPMMLVRLLSKSDYGTYQQAQLITSIVTGLFVLGIPSSIYYFYQPERETSRAALVQQTLGLLFASGLIAALSMVLFAPLVGDWVNNDALRTFLPIVAATAGFSIAGEHFVHFMIAKNRYSVAVLFETGETIVRVALLVAPLLAGFGLAGVFWTIAVFSLARLVVRNLLMLRDVGWKLVPSPGSQFVAEQLSYSLPMCLTAMVGLIGGALDRMIIAANFTPSDYAIYAVGTLEIPLDSIFQVAVANVLRATLPSLVRTGQYDEIARLIREAVRKLSIIMVPSFLFLFGFAHEFITLLFTNNYSGSVVVFRIYLLLIPLHMLILSPIPQAFGKTKINLYLAIGVTLIHVALSFILLHWIGYLGPAISSITVTYILALAYIIVGTRLLRTSPWKMIPIPQILRVTGAGTFALAATRFLMQGMSNTLVSFTASAIVFSVVFFAAAMPLRVFLEQDRALVRRWYQRLAKTGH